jgi:nicotinamide-nucleotide amidase
MTTLIQKVSENLHKNKMRVATAESCTGGWLAKQITDLAGSSAIFDRGFVTYSNQSKIDMLSVKPATLDKHGAVSEAVVIEMAQGALTHSQADIAVSISGIAGPDGGSAEKPVGTVCFGWQQTGKKVIVKTHIFEGGRDSIRAQAVDYALNGIDEIISK